MTFTPLGGDVPIHSTIDKNKGLVIGMAWGRITFDEITAYQDKLLGDPNFSPAFNQLMDASKVTDWCLSIEQVENAARREFFSPLSKRAFVGPLPSESPLARILGAYNELTKHLSRIQLFQDVAAAVKWLDLEVLPEIDPIGQS